MRGAPEFVVVSAVPAGKGIISEPKLTPPLVDRFMRISPSVPLPPPVLVCHATHTSPPLGATATSDGHVKPSLPPEIFPEFVVHVAPWLVDRARRTGAPDRLKSCQMTYRLSWKGLAAFLSAAIHSLSRLLVATSTALPTVAPVVGLIC